MNYFLGIRASDGVLVADFEEGAAGATPGLNHPITGTTPIAIAPAVPTDADWHHAAVTYDGTTLRLYLDGNARKVAGRRAAGARRQHPARRTGHGLHVDGRRGRILRRRARRGACLELRPQRLCRSPSGQDARNPGRARVAGPLGLQRELRPRARLVGQQPPRHDVGRGLDMGRRGAPFTGRLERRPRSVERRARIRPSCCRPPASLTGIVADDSVSGLPVLIYA